MSAAQPLHERIYLALRTSILSGEFSLGNRLTETKLAKQLQVSRTPIREAIRRLQQEQLLTSDSPEGVTVVEISLDSAIHLYDCRIALEQLAVKGACLHATAAQLQVLEQNLLKSEAVLREQMNAPNLSVADKTEYDLKQLALNYEFHRLIAESSQNPWLVSLLDQLANQTKLLRLQILQVPLDVKSIQMEHWQLFQALFNRDSETAVGLIRDHLELSQQRVIQVFEQSQRAVKREKLACPSCHSHHVKKNGRRQDKQNYCCKNCGRQFIATVVHR